MPSSCDTPNNDTLAGSSPAAAFLNDVDVLREALGCVTQERLVATEPTRRIEAGPNYSLQIGVIEPIPLRVNSGLPHVRISIGQSVRCVQTGSPRRQERYAIVVVAYFYALTTADGNEILAFHWTPVVDDPNQHTFPHLHVGAINLNANGPIRPGTFHKMHIPTSHVPVEAVIRLAITELNVRPLRTDWEEVLRRTERSRDMLHLDVQ